MLEGPEYRTIFLGLDQFREELPGSDVKGKNPLKDLRVRKALYQAIDIQSIQRVVLRLAQPTGTLVANQVNGWTKKTDVRCPYDPKARKAAGRCGLPQRVRGGLCVQRGPLHQRRTVVPGDHLALGQVGVKAKLRSLPLPPAFR